VVSDDTNRPVALADLVGRHEQDARRLTFVRNEYDAAQLIVDVRQMIERLPAALQSVADALQTDATTAAARKLGVSRKAFTRGMRRIYRSFERAGLQEYLQK
jgi:hypothetical protein